VKRRGNSTEISLSRFQEKLARIAKKLEKIKEKKQELSMREASLQRKRTALRISMRHFFPTAVPTQEEHPEPVQETAFQSLTIANAAAVVLSDNGDWMSAKQIQKELDRRGKYTRYAALDVALKTQPSQFERKKERNRNLFRLPSES